MRQAKRIAVSLFAGAGGLDLGVEEAGYKIVHAVENDPTSVATLNANRAEYFQALPEVTPTDITQTDPREVMRHLGLVPGEVDLLVGGPPCVAFSKSGFHLEYKRLGLDPRADLLGNYVSFLDALRPAGYVMENVYGLAYKNRSAAFFQRLREEIQRIGYSVQARVLNAADYGVPQNRQRLFLIGARDGRALRHPKPTHWGQLERRAKPHQADGLNPHITAGLALDGVDAQPEASEEVGGKYGHLLGDIPPGSNYLFYTEHEGHPNPLFRWRSRYWTFLLKLDPDRPSSTIQGQPGPYVGPFHWENRRLRVPELKRLQAFPQDYQFVGSRREIQLQIGNAVPPLLAERVTEAVSAQLLGDQAPPTELEESLQLSLDLVGSGSSRR